MKWNSCPVCGQKISNKWLYFSRIDKKYVCHKCNNVIAWNRYKRISGRISIFISMFSSVTFIRYTFIEKLKISLTYKALLVGTSVLIIGFFVDFLLNVILPKQFSIEESEIESFN